MNPRLRLKNTLAQGETAFASFNTLRGVRAAQTLAHTGVDSVIVDCEHGDTDMHDMVAAISGSGCSPGIRIKGGSSENLKRALDTGAHAILVPMVHTAEQAKSIVNMSKFPPEGIRGQGSPFACHEFGLATPADYVREANKSVLIMAQIESKEGVENIDAICNVPGIDVVVIGPNDLSLAILGRLPAKAEDTVFHDAVDRVIKAAKAAGKKSGLVVTDGTTARKAAERFDLIVLSADVRALQAWYKQELSIAKPKK